MSDPEASETALVPADRRVPARVSSYAQPDLAAAIDALEDAIGGREALTKALLLAPGDDEDLTYAIHLIADPRHDARTLSTLCLKAGIPLGELLEAYKRGRYALLQVQVAEAVATKTPAVVEDVLTRAAPHLIECATCAGTGSVRGKPCACATTETPGRTLVLPDLDRQELALKLANLLPKAGPMVGIVNQLPTPSLDPSPQGFGQLLKGIDEILKRAPGPSRPAPVDVVDADPVDS